MLLTATVPPSVQLTLRHFKGNTSRVPFNIVIQSTPTSRYCPVRIFTAYLNTCSSIAGSLFCWPSLRPDMRTEFSAILSQALIAAGKRQPYIRPHSVRIGAATSAAIAGVPDEQIQRLGRWKSDAYRRFIRIPHLTSP